MGKVCLDDKVEKGLRMLRKSLTDPFVMMYGDHVTYKKGKPYLICPKTKRSFHLVNRTIDTISYDRPLSGRRGIYRCCSECRSALSFSGKIC